MEADVYTFRDQKPIADTIHPYPDTVKQPAIPLVIDHGLSVPVISEVFLVTNLYISSL